MCYSVCWRLWSVGRLCFLEELRVSEELEAMRCVLLCLLEAVERR